jgi:hypothetical protein
MTILGAKISLLITVCFFSLATYGQSYLLNNEQLIFSFDTKSGKHVILAKDRNNRYIVYRFGGKTKIEFEYPDKSIASWKKFKYSYYLRGGGAQNDGEDLNYIYFINDSFQYTIYDTYHAEGDISRVGIRVVNLRTKKTVYINGNYQSVKGTLTDFRDNNFLEITDDATNEY